MKVAIVLRSTEHQPVSTTIVSYMACVSGLVSGEHVLDAVVAVAFVQPLDRAVFIDVAVLCPVASMSWMLLLQLLSFSPWIVLFLLMLLSCGKHVLDAVVAAAFVQPLDPAVFIDVAVLWQACP